MPEVQQKSLPLSAVPATATAVNGECELGQSSKTVEENYSMVAMDQNSSKEEHDTTESEDEVKVELLHSYLAEHCC